MDLKFRKTGNEITVLSIFVFVCCVVGAGLDWITDKHLNLRIVGLGCWFLIMGLFAQHLRNKKRTQTPETALPQPGK